MLEVKKKNSGVSFLLIMETRTNNQNHHKVLNTALLETPLGQMQVIADNQTLYLLNFVDSRGLEKAMARLKKTKLPIIVGKSKPIKQIEAELEEYFLGKIHVFKTPLFLLGSPFQKEVWEALQKIPAGETKSYAEIAKAIGNPSAFRAVGMSNGANQFAIAIPCHRVINSNGDLGGYSGGLEKKEWLLNHERQFLKKS